MCTATRGCTNLKLVPMLFAPYLGTNINITFQNSKILFFHRTLMRCSVLNIILFFDVYSGENIAGDAENPEAEESNQNSLVEQGTKDAE